MEPHIIKRYIDRDAMEYSRRRRMFAYYRGENDITRRTLIDDSKPNNRLAHAYPYMIATSYAGYLFGEPVTYTSDDARLLESVTDVNDYNDEQAENAALGLDLAICGAAAEVLYVDADGQVRFRRVDPVGVIGVYDDTIEENLTEVIRYYDVFDVEHNTSEARVEVLDAQNWSVYRYFGGGFELLEERPHGFHDVPAVLYRNNSEGAGDFERVVSLIDAYDKMQSEALNDQEYFSDAYLKLRGMQGTTAEDLAEMKRNRALLLPEDGDAEFLIKQAQGETEEQIKERLNNDIHRFSGCPDMSDEKFAGDSSGVAMKYKLLQFENITGVKERAFKLGLQRRLELLCNIWQTLGRGSFDWRAVEIAFHRTLPQNLLEAAQIVNTIGSLLSDETKRSILPLDIDEEAEKQRLEEQRDVGMEMFAMNMSNAANLSRDAEDVNGDAET